MRSRFVLALLCALGTGMAQIRVVPLPGNSPLINLRVVWETGSTHDPAGQEGVAYITAQMLAQGGTREMTYKQVLEAFFPMAVSVQVQVDKEMTAFSAQTHEDNLKEFTPIFTAMPLDPGWREEDFQRVKEDAINFLKVNLRQNNDEELGKEVLYARIHKNTPYEHYSVGSISSLEKLTLADVRKFYSTNYTQDRLYLGLAGRYPQLYPRQMRAAFRKLPRRAPLTRRFIPAKPLEENQVAIVQKETRSVAYSLGFPIIAGRRHPDFVPLLVASTYFGHHRTSGGRLYTRMRELRGLNYGDYSYIEYFPRGMFQFEPDPNLVRQQQIFQIWIRPVEPPTAHFALRLAMFEFSRLVEQGLSEEEFQRTKSFLSKNVDLLMRTKDAELGYLIDSIHYHLPMYNRYVKDRLRYVTRNGVNTAIRRHFGNRKLQIVGVAKDAEALKTALVDNTPSPIKYNAEKPPEILEEDKVIEQLPLDIKAENVSVVSVEQVFQ